MKKKLPDLQVIVGGPETLQESKYILENPAIDMGCFGEGEFIFAEILAQMLKTVNDFSRINGIFYKKNNKIVWLMGPNV